MVFIFGCKITALCSSILKESYHILGRMTYLGYKELVKNSTFVYNWSVPPVKTFKNLS